MERGFTVRKSEGDADILIVKEAIELAQDNKEVIVAADDTDVLALLMYHWSNLMGDVYFSTVKREGKRKSATLQFWSICHLVEAHSHVEHLLFAHAWTGCDTTSAAHQKGKPVVSLFYINSK